MAPAAKLRLLPSRATTAEQRPWTQSGGSAAEAVPVSCIIFAFLQMLPLLNICTSVTNLHTISHFIFDNVKFVLLYGRVVVAERRRQSGGPGHKAVAAAGQSGYSVVL
jgi:hypothetical protein